MSQHNHTNDTDAIRVAAIDIGSNSIRLTVAESDAPNRYRVLTDEKVTARLATTNPDGTLQQQRIETAAQAIANMAETARGYGATTINAVATAAVRDAPNAEKLTALIKQRTGLDTHILTGKDEARLAHDSVAQAFDLHQTQTAVLDIGGGSTDIAISTSAVIERLISMPLGVVRLADKHGKTDQHHQRNYDAMRRDIEHTIEQHLPKLGTRPALVVGTGGTFTALAEILLSKQNNTPPRKDAPATPGRVRGFEVKLAQVAHTLYDLRRLDDAQRAKLPGLSEARAEIIVPGLAIVDATMRKLHANTLRVHDRGVRDGIILAMLRDARQQHHKPTPPHHLDDAKAFAARCGTDLEQSRHVADLALSLFDQTAQQFTGEGQPEAERAWTTNTNRQILEAAALLRDVGYFINYKAHHKHSYHLIAHADLEPFTPAQTERIALVARYHRRAKPKKKHDAFARLDAAEKHTVRALAAILRIADGLDRTHSRNVTAVRLQRQPDHALFKVRANSDPAADLAGAKHKANLFEATFETTARFLQDNTF